VQEINVAPPATVMTRPLRSPWRDHLLVWANRGCALKWSSPNWGSCLPVLQGPRPGLLLLGKLLSEAEAVHRLRLDRNSRLSAQLPWLFLVSGLIHYLKVIQREHIGAAKEKEDLQRELEVAQPVRQRGQEPVGGAKARCPLSMGRITVTDIADEPDFFAVNMTVRPTSCVTEDPRGYS